MSNSIAAVRAYVLPDLLRQAAEYYKESENGVSKAIGALVPAILTGLLQKTHEPAMMDRVFKLLARFDAEPVLANPGALFTPGNISQNEPRDTSGQLLGWLFGPKVPAITEAVAAFAEVRTTTAASLLGFAGPLLLAVLSRKVRERGVDQTGLGKLLAEERAEVFNLLPTGLATVLGLSPDTPMPNEAQYTSQAYTGQQWLWPLLLLLACGGGIMYYLKACRPNPPVVHTALPAPVQVPTPAQPTAESGIYMDTLPGGFALHGTITGIESQLVTFIRDANRSVDKTTWFNFDRLNFRTGSAELDMDYSRQQLLNIYEVLQAFPRVKLKIGGYTDNVGQEADNQRLSQQRAETVRSALLQMGIAKDRLAAEGYGSQHPVASNDTEAGRAENRRTSVRVVEK